MHSSKLSLLTSHHSFCAMRRHGCIREPIIWQSWSAGLWMLSAVTCRAIPSACSGKQMVHMHQISPCTWLGIIVSAPQMYVMQMVPPLQAAPCLKIR